jgi:multiple sugar transport system ATP-binding protein
MAKLSVQHVSIGNADIAGKGTGAAGVDDFSLEVADREFVAIAGPEGCGSSSIVRAIAGLEAISSGEIQIADKNINGMTPRERDVAMVFPTPALYPNLSAHDNMALGLKRRKFSPAEIKRRVSDAAILGIESLLDRKAAGLSDVEALRVAIGRAVARQPKVFLFDHALVGFDAATGAQLRAELIRLHQQLQATMVFATANSQEALTMASRIAAMNGGVMQQAGAAAVVYGEPENVFVGGFFGSPPMNFIKGAVRGSGDALSFKEAQGGVVDFRLGARSEMQRLAGKEVIAGIRPEHVEIITGAAPPGGLRFQALLDIVEPLGGEAIAHIQTGAHTLKSRTRAPLGGEDAGHRVQFAFDPAKVLYFDPETTRRISA